MPLKWFLFLLFSQCLEFIFVVLIKFVPIFRRTGLNGISIQNSNDVFQASVPAGDILGCMRGNLDDVFAELLSSLPSAVPDNSKRIMFVSHVKARLDGSETLSNVISS